MIPDRLGRLPTALTRLKGTYWPDHHVSQMGPARRWREVILRRWRAQGSRRLLAGSTTRGMSREGDRRSPLRRPGWRTELAEIR